MKKHLISLTVVMVLTALAWGAPALVRAQSDPLICDAFPDASTDIRTSYYMGEGMGYFTSGNNAEALDSFSCVTDQINPSYVPALLSRAAVYAEYRSYEEALEDYDQAISLDARSVAAFNNRGIVFAAQGEYDKALADFSQAITLDSANALAYDNRAVIEALQGNYSAAISDLNQAITLSGIDAILAELRDPERDPDAEWPEFDPDFAHAYALLGIVYEMQARDNFNTYTYLLGGAADQRVQNAAGALESRFAFDLRLDDGTWLFAANFSPAG